MKPYWHRLTLRNRTAFIITLFIWVTGISIGWICRSSFQYLLLRQTDSDLRDDVGDFASALDQAQLPFAADRVDSWNRRVALHPLYRLFIRVAKSDRGLIWESITAPPTLSLSTVSDPETIQQEQSYRFIQQSIGLSPTPTEHDSQASASIDAVLQVGYSIDLVTNTISQFDRWLFGALGILFIGAPFTASLLAYWLLRPLQDLTVTTKGIALGSQRLIDRNDNGDEIDGLAETLNSLLTQIRSQLRENEDWIANSAHQLRAPLAAIISNVEVVAGRIPDGKSSEMLQRVLSECQYLKRLVSQLLLLGEAKSDRQSKVRQEVAWNELVEKSSDFYEALAHSRNIEVRFSRLDPCTVFANPEHLRFVIHNLIDNAIKYTLEGGVIDVALQRNDAIRVCTLSVRDTGIGISPEDLPKIGQRFFRSNSGRDPSQTPRGTGLGLHIVMSIVGSMGGKSEVVSQLGMGTEVRVSLPLALKNDPSEPAESNH